MYSLLLKANHSSIWNVGADGGGSSIQRRRSCNVHGGARQARQLPRPMEQDLRQIRDLLRSQRRCPYRFLHRTGPPSSHIYLVHGTTW